MLPKMERLQVQSEFEVMDIDTAKSSIQRNYILDGYSKEMSIG